ncbi:MAG: hypothetical protein ACF787_07960 [Rhodopirellula sp. JB053]
MSYPMKQAREAGDVYRRANVGAGTVWMDRLPMIGSSVSCRTARTRIDYEAAFSLLQRRYQEVGLAEAHRDSPVMRVLPYHLTRQSQVFVASVDGRTIGTVTLVLGTAGNLPMERMYPGVVSRWKQFYRLGELASLAIDPRFAKPRVAFMELTRLASAFAQYQGIDSLAAVVHPRHAKFYKHALGFQVIGVEKRCDLVGGRPGVPVLGSINRPCSQSTRLRRFYTNCDYPTNKLMHRPMREIDQIYFRRWCGNPRFQAPSIGSARHQRAA